ncbi:MAG: amidohydrolase family protein [Halieaceae bacterium]|jgi:predicted amidohydrolase YtcJ|nr:amidohydrolase family protein [Halieaceae bacterium]
MTRPTPRLALAIFATAIAATLWGCQDKPGAQPADTRPASQAPAAKPVAERVYVNGAIYTADKLQQTASAMAVGGDRILFVGDDEAAAAWIGDDTVVTDLQGKRVLPGLHDAHVHPVETVKIDRCDLANEPLDLGALADFVSACLARLQLSPGDWLVVKNWNFSDGNKPAEGLRTLRTALDRASGTHPILLENSDSHHFATNSAGLARARTVAGEQVGLSAATLPLHFEDLAPFIGVDAAGEPNGEVHETVYLRLGVSRAELMNLAALIPEIGQMPAWFNSRGITSLLEAAFYPELAPAYDSLASQGGPSLRITLAQFYEPAEFSDSDGALDMDAILSQARATREKYDNVENIKADHLKYFVDGVLEGNPLATPPTLPNGAQLEDFHQPTFALEAASQEIRLGAYVDPDSAVCKAAGTNPPNRADVEAFIAAKGFHPAQCLRSNGVLFEPVETTRRFLEAADANDFSVHFHAIGDRAVRVATDAIAAVTTAAPVANRHSIAHAQLVNPDDIPRIAALKIPVAFTYNWAIRDHGYDLTVIPFIDRIDSLQAMYDPANYYMRHAYPAGAILAAGGVLTAGSDAPVVSDDPMPFQNIEMAVTRDDGEGPLNARQAIGILDALDAYTINGARMLRQDAITGSLEAGKKADFIILDRDPIALANSGKAEEISGTRVLETWFDGVRVYQQEQ